MPPIELIIAFSIASPKGWVRGFELWAKLAVLLKKLQYGLEDHGPAQFWPIQLKLNLFIYLFIFDMNLFIYWNPKMLLAFAKWIMWLNGLC